MTEQTITIVLSVEEHDLPMMNRLKRLLKIALRRFGFKCVTFRVN